MEITIHRCTLRVIRRGGWSWGSEPRRLVQVVARVLPLLLARRLEALWPDGTDGEISAPAALRLPVRLADLIAVAAEVQRSGVEAALVEDRAAAALDELLERAATELAARVRPVRCVPGAPAEPESPVDETCPTARSRGCTDALAVLLRWRERGSLPALLRGFSVAALQAWEEAVWQLPVEGTAPPADATEIEALLVAIVRALDAAPAKMLPAGSAPSSARAVQLRRRMLALVEIAARLKQPPSSATVRAAIDRALPLAPETVQARPPEPRARAAEPLTLPPQVSTAPAHARVAPLPLLQHTVERDCRALPFLLLGPLSQIGFIDAAGAAFAAAQREDALAALAAGLALKVLPPAERGWRRRPEELASAAAFAGLDGIPDELAGLADQPLDDVLPPLEAVIARAVLDAHTAGQPLVVQRVDGGLVVADGEGLFPVGFCAPEVLPELLVGVADLLFVPIDAAEPRLLAALDCDGHRFITDAPPTRGERWRRLQGAPTDRFWTNDAATPDVALCALARPLPDLADELGLTWRALTVERPTAPRARHPSLDRTLALAAGVALACIAWTLWRTRETPHPRLTLARFGDLDARLRFNEHTVEVKLPLGRRHQDLQAHRLLDDVRDVPWLGGRIVQFCGG